MSVMTLYARMEQAMRDADRTVSRAVVEAAFNTALLEIKLLHKITKNTVGCLGEYPEKPGAKSIYDAGILVVQQFDPDRPRA